jgi:peptide/nickel transport system permease protein
LSLLIAFPIGLLYGGIAGYVGGMVDNLMMRFAEIMMSIPSLYLLLSLAAILPPGLPSGVRFALVTAILAFIGWAGLSRVIRGMVLTIKTQEFIEAERALGMNHLAVILKHILPQTASYVMVAITVVIPGYILAESGLSFLGLGIQQPDPSWGNMLKEAQELTNLLYRPWMLMPGLLIFLAVLSFNVLGDALRDHFDPKAYQAKKAA